MRQTRRRKDYAYGNNLLPHGRLPLTGHQLSDPPPDLIKPLGKYGQLRQRYLQEHRTIFYNTLLLSERLYPHLRDVDDTARERKRHSVSEESILAELIYE